jgi:cobalt-zinc-cadmium efflux system outer membrane protein
VKHIVPIGVALLALLGARTGAAQGGSASSLTLDDAVARARVANADLAAARLRVDSARAEHTIAIALPNPVFSATPANPSQYAAQLPLDIGPARYFRTRVASQGVSASRFDVLDVDRQIVFAVRQAFYDVLLADSLEALAANQADTFRQLLAADSARLRDGSIAERELTSTRLQLAHANALLARAVVQQHGTRLTLEMLMGVSAPDTLVRLSGALVYRPIAVNADSVLALAQANRPDLAASALRVNQSASAVSLARAALVPVPLLGAVYQPAQPFASGSHYAPSVGVSLPLLYAFSGERNRARASLDAARVASQHARLQVHADVMQAFDGYLTAREMADRYACGLLADAAAALDATRYAYERGAAALPDVLEAIRSYADTRSDYLTAVHDYWVSLFALERAAGTRILPE